MKKVIVRIKGGIGNQLFCYAAARRLALVNEAELVLDNVTGFTRDRLYCRRYMLDHFSIAARKATPAERLEPFERYRRGVKKYLSRRKPFAQRRYLEQEGLDFEERLLALKVDGTLYLDGYWQSEDYFKDVEQTIRDDLRIIPPTDTLNHSIADRICSSHAVALHMRWFNAPDSAETHNASVGYYRRAVAMFEEMIEPPHYFLFSDNLDAARFKLSLPEDRVTFVSHNQGDENACADLWLMSKCRHFITANSTFSWWGAWLGERKDKIVVCPKIKTQEGKKIAWNLHRQIPRSWRLLY